MQIPGEYMNANLYYQYFPKLAKYFIQTKEKNFTDLLFHYKTYIVPLFSSYKLDISALNLSINRQAKNFQEKRFLNYKSIFISIFITEMISVSGSWDLNSDAYKKFEDDCKKIEEFIKKNY
jgi:hypothetical protein